MTKGSSFIVIESRYVYPFFGTMATWHGKKDMQSSNIEVLSILKAPGSDKSQDLK